MTDWPHAPVHRFDSPGAYIVTAATHQKSHYFSNPERRQRLTDFLFETAEEFHWQLQAWAVLSNHYHFVMLTTGESPRISEGISKLHTLSSIWLNNLDSAPGRKVWFQYWDTHITHQKSYFARLNYVHCNPARHGIVRNPEEYPWCSSGWFAKNADMAFRKTVGSFKTDRVNVPDDF